MPIIPLLMALGIMVMGVSGSHKRVEARAASRVASAEAIQFCHEELEEQRGEAELTDREARQYLKDCVSDYKLTKAPTTLSQGSHE